MAPAKVMVCPGFEPNHHIGEYGSAEQYVAMRRRFAARFAVVHVSNVVWVMDYQRAIYKSFDPVKATWPGHAIVDWLMWNAFGDTDKGTKTKGNFTKLLQIAYDELLQASPAFGFDKATWGIGAYGPKAPVMSPKARVRYMDDVIMDLDRTRFPRLKAMIYFDSLNCSVTKDLAPTYNRYLHSPYFTVNDHE